MREISDDLGIERTNSDFSDLASFSEFTLKEI